MSVNLGLALGAGFQWKPSLKKVDYSGIITTLNFLTDMEDAAYNGTNPSLESMETQLDDINGEIISAV